MEIERTTFGTITIDGKTYEHDVIIRLSGEVARRKKQLSKKYYGTSHVLSKDEAKFVFENGCEQLILGTGQMGNVHLSPEAEAYFAKKGCAVLLQPTPRAIHTFNSSHAKKIGLFHVTCWIGPAATARRRRMSKAREATTEHIRARPLYPQLRTNTLSAGGAVGSVGPAAVGCLF
jgi:hypothetical protein